MGNAHYVRLETRWHDDPVVRALPVISAWLYGTLMSTPLMTAVPGLIRTGLAGLSERMNTRSLEFFREQLQPLIEAGLVLVDWEKRLCYLPALAEMECSAAHTIYQASHWRRVLDGCQPCPLLERVERDVRVLLERKRAAGTGKAMLASFLVGQPVTSSRADIVLSSLATPPAQPPLPFQWAPPPDPGHRPLIHILQEVSPPMPASYPDGNTATGPQVEALGSADPTSASDAPAAPDPDDNAVAAFQEVVAGAGGMAAVGIAVARATDATGLPGNAATLWCHYWYRLRRERPGTTLRSARTLGEHGRAGGWDGLRVPYQALTKSLDGLWAMLDQAEIWHQRGRPSLGRGGPQAQTAGDDIIAEALRSSRRTG